jgi:hypothetical protein
MSWSIFNNSQGGGAGAAVTWAQDFLQALGAPLTQSNILFVFQWEMSEGSGGTYNPLNQGNVPGAPQLTSNQGPQYGGGANDYVSWQAGIQGSVDFLHMSNYTQVYKALMQGNGDAAKTALWASQWAQSHYGYGANWSNAQLVAAAPLNGDTAGINSPLNPYNPTINPATTLSGPELAQQYGFAYSMLTAIPELDKLFQQAVAGQWSTSRFTAALMATTWYQTHSAAQRAYIAEGYADPTTQQQQIQSQLANVYSMAAKFGMDVPANIAQQLAQQYLQNGWNDTQLQDAMSKYIQFNQYGGLGGSSGQLEMTLRGLANSNGVTVSNDWVLNVARAVADNTTSIEDAEAYLRSQAEKLFPGFSTQIKAGQNMSDLAAPYITDYQKILEVSPNQTTLFDPTLVKALQNKTPVGQAVTQPVNTPMPLWQFDNVLRQDPRWGKTQNAQNSTMAVAHQVLQQFGFEF